MTYLQRRCKQTINLIPGDEVVSANADDEAESRILMKKRRCLVQFGNDRIFAREHTKLHLRQYPDCAAFAFEDGAFKIKGYEGPTLACDKCGSEMQLRTGRFGKYFGCTGKVEVSLVRTPESCFVTGKRHHRKWILYRCLSFSARRSRIPICCAMVLPVYFSQQVNSQKIERQEHLILMSYSLTK